MARKSFAGLLLLILGLVLCSSLWVQVNADAPSARASHILVDTEAECDKLLGQLEKSENLEEKFAELAKSHSKCPSSRRGGDLGQFGRGQMVPEFDKVVFEREVGIVHKVRTQFGWHLVLTTERNGMGDLDDEKDDL